MPPLKEVQSLYFLCLDRVFESLFDEIAEGIGSDRLEKIRHRIITNLHGGIREHILKLAVLRDRNRIEVLLQLINILIDPNITYLCCYSGCTFRILPKHYCTLVTHLKVRNAIGLKFLHIVVDYKRPENKSKDPVIETNFMFHSLLEKGLAKSLTVLVLRSCCDNEILRILGKHCIHLTKLDITKSWYVNDNGFKYLCLKEPDSVESACERYSRSPQFIMQLMSLKETDLNPCCFTLSDVRLQETNTTDLAVLMLLIFLKNLKRFGGFIYSRSVVDNIIFLSRLAEGNLKMNFTELYDTHLTDAKLNHLSNIVPDLTDVYTRNIYLHPMLAKFRKLSEITIDFDFQQYEENFFVFISSCGSQLKRITLVDKHGCTDMLRILKFCPNLVEINGSLTINDSKRRFTVSHLKKANLKINVVDVIQWMLLNAPNLEHLEICFADYRSNGYEPTSFGNDVLENIIREKPACSNTLKYLVVIPTYIYKIKERTVMEFIFQFKELRFLGDLCSWGVSAKMVSNIKKKVRSKNWDMTLLWDQTCESVVTMNSLRELNMSMEWKSLKPGIGKKY